MGDFPVLQTTLQTRFNSRSMGLKLIVVCGLALIMMIPALLVSGLVQDRTDRAKAVAAEISGHVGGQQTFLGPTLTQVRHELIGSCYFAVSEGGKLFWLNGGI